ncbi:PREDICTED: protein CROWDED NUCLEI 2-like [Branchiostoma belcheri]|uniref:Protein CROWDED NUCLEI 2-like n=1 Tax=Branchiostoma belcheri TaxID=7741 RepID=A0A6P4XPV2_BRABE|nr:PREDICTED: protein CROWDED NUCLEI 2-like [Branchiostoma belcheri]
MAASSELFQVEMLMKGIQEVAEQNSATKRQVEERHQALAEKFQNVVGNLQEAMSASLLEQDSQKENAEAALKEAAENEAEVRAWEEEQERRVAALRAGYDGMLGEMAAALQRGKAQEQERYEDVRQRVQLSCQQLRTDMKERYDRMRFELDERQGRMNAKHDKESKDLQRMTDLARLRVREAEQELAMVLMRTEHAKHELRMLRRKFFPSEDPKKKKTKVPRQEVTDDLNSDLDRLVKELGMRVQEFNQIEVQIELHLAGETGGAGDGGCAQDGDLNPEEEMARLETALDFKLREIESLQRRMRDKQIQMSYGRSDSKSQDFFKSREIFGSRRSGLRTGSRPPATSGGRSDVTWDSVTSVVRLSSDESLSPWRQRSLTPLSPTTSPPREDQEVTSSPEGLSSGIGSLKAGPGSGIGSLNQSWGSSISVDHRRRLAPLRAPGSAPEVSRKEASGPEGRPRCSSSPSVRTKAEH